jgi:hypothetical protein
MKGQEFPDELIDLVASLPIRALLHTIEIYSAKNLRSSKQKENKFPSDSSVKTKILCICNKSV